MKYKHFTFCLILLIIPAFTTFGQVKKLEATSPDRAIVFSLLINDGQVKYAIKRNNYTILSPSVVGITVNEQQIGSGKSITIMERKAVNSTYAIRGVHSMAIDKYNLIRVKIQALIPYQLEIKIFNDGVAFRYIIANQSNALIKSEQTAFNLPFGCIVWSQNSTIDYQGKYQERKIEDIKQGDKASPPITIKLAGNVGYAAITEGGVKDFAGMYLTAAGNGSYQVTLQGVVNKTGIIETPWRIVMIGKTLNELVNNDIVNSVSAPMDKKLFPDGYNTSWIKPAKGVWSWLSGRNESVTFENMKRFCDEAAELGIEYNLVDAGWVKWEDGAKDKWALMKELVDYARPKGVKIWVWKAYPDKPDAAGLKNIAERTAFFKKCAEIGIVGIKLDWFNSESQEVMNYYQSALRDAAKLHLMLNFHGADKPTGQSRTWPNEMTREGIRGLEAKTSWPKHNTTLLFTRYLAGHADYTPLSFTDIANGTTLTHQVATVCAFTSPFMCLGVIPGDLLKSNVKEIIKQMPVIWDETIVLPQSQIGQLAILARRSKNVWYLAALNGEQEQSVTVKLDLKGVVNDWHLLFFIKTAKSLSRVLKHFHSFVSYYFNDVFAYSPKIYYCAVCLKQAKKPPPAGMFKVVALYFV